MKKIYSTLLFCLFLLLGSTKAQNQNALAFDGTNDLVRTQGASALIAGSNAISMTCWVYPQNPSPNGTYDGFCGFRNNSDADFYILHFNTTTLEVRFRNSAGGLFDIISGGIQLNTWQHLALTYDGSQLRFYRNGVRTDSIAASGNIVNPADTFYIGGLPFGGSIFNLIGKLDEVSLWSKTLSASEVKCIYSAGIDSTEAGLQLLYKFNQGVAGGNNSSITTITDGTGHIDGIPSNFSMTGTASNFVAGKTNVFAATATFCPGSNYIWGNDTLTEKGVYTQVYNTIAGCDSTVQLTLNSVLDTSVTRSGFIVFAIQTGVGVAYQWLDCNNAFAPISGATNQAYVPSVIGSYAVKITYSGCTDTSSCYTFTSVGIAENDYNSNIIISPNPAKDFCTISAPAISNATLLLYDVVGKIVVKQKFNSMSELPLTTLNSGVYFIEFRNTNGIIARKKLVKE